METKIDGHAVDASRDSRLCTHRAKESKEFKGKLQSEVEACRELKKLIDSGRVELTNLHPGASFDAKEKQWNVGPIARQHPGDATPLPPWVYKQVRQADLYFEVTRSDDKDAFEIMARLISNLCAYSHQTPRTTRPYDREKRTIKPEFVITKEIEDDLAANNTRRIEELISELASLGVDTGSLNYSEKAYQHPEWYNVERFTDYAHEFCISSQAGLLLWDMLDYDGLIEKATPNWYRTGKF